MIFVMYQMASSSETEAGKTKPTKQQRIFSVGSIPIIPQKAWLNVSFKTGVRKSGHRLWTAREHVLLCRVIQQLFPAQEVFRPAKRVENIKIIVKKIPEVLNVSEHDVWEYLGALGIDMQETEAPKPVVPERMGIRKKLVKFRVGAIRSSNHSSKSLSAGSPLGLRIGAVMSHLKLPTRISSEEVFRYHYRPIRRGCFSVFNTWQDVSNMAAGSNAVYSAVKGPSFEDLIELVFSEMIKLEGETLSQDLWKDILNHIVMIENFRLKQFRKVCVDVEQGNCLLCSTEFLNRNELEKHLFSVHDDLFDQFEDYLINEKEAKEYVGSPTLLALIDAREALHRPRGRSSNKIPSVPDGERLSVGIRNFLIQRPLRVPKKNKSPLSSLEDSSSSNSSKNSISSSSVSSSSSSDSPKNSTSSSESSSSESSSDESIEERSLLSMVTPF